MSSLNQALAIIIQNSQQVVQNYAVLSEQEIGRLLMYNMHNTVKQYEKSVAMIDSKENQKREGREEGEISRTARKRSNKKQEAKLFENVKEEGKDKTRLWDRIDRKVAYSYEQMLQDMQNQNLYSQMQQQAFQFVDKLNQNSTLSSQTLQNPQPDNFHTKKLLFAAEDDSNRTQKKSRKSDSSFPHSTCVPIRRLAARNAPLLDAPRKQRKYRKIYPLPELAEDCPVELPRGERVKQQQQNQNTREGGYGGSTLINT